MEAKPKSTLINFIENSLLGNLEHGSREDQDDQAIFGESTNNSNNPPEGGQYALNEADSTFEQTNGSFDVPVHKSNLSLTNFDQTFVEQIAFQYDENMTRTFSQSNAEPDVSRKQHFSGPNPYRPLSYSSPAHIYDQHDYFGFESPTWNHPLSTSANNNNNNNNHNYNNTNNLTNPNNFLTNDHHHQGFALGPKSGQSPHRAAAPSPLDESNSPPFSRIFVVCGKKMTQEKLALLFQCCGKIQTAKIVKDRVTQESRGLAYLKFSKASEAALAVEKFHGYSIEEGSMRVMVAEEKGKPKKVQPEVYCPEDTPARSRLFVICPKETEEDEFNQLFANSADLEYAKLMRDTSSGLGKGFGFVKFKKASSAAIAMEALNERHNERSFPYKALIAEPRAQTRKSFGVVPSLFPFASVPPVYLPSDPFQFMSQSSQSSQNRLFVVCPKNITQENLARLFDLIPGLEYCDLKVDKETGESKGFAYVKYSNPTFALMAKEKFDKFAFPQGHHLKVLFAEERNQSQPKTKAPDSSNKYNKRKQNENLKSGNIKEDQKDSLDY